MSKSQYFVLLAAVLLIVGLALMPRAVVKNNNKQMEAEATTSDASTSEETQTNSHAKALPEKEQKEINGLKDLFVDAKEEKTKLTYLNQLIDAYKKVNRYDSAAYYAEQFADEFPSEIYLLKAGDLYYEAFTFALDAQKIERLGVKTREVLQKYQEKKPEDLDAKVKIGMTYVSSSSPMQGIMMLREVIQEDPNHRLGLFNLGVLSMQSGQFDKAVGRFEKLVELDSKDIQSRFYLGLSYKETGQKAKAIEHLTYVKENESNPEILSTVDKYLAELNTNN